MNKITPDHLARSAYVYVQQSTPDQLVNNPESRRRQCALTTRARALGWEAVIDMTWNPPMTASSARTGSTSVTITRDP